MTGMETPGVDAQPTAELVATVFARGCTSRQALEDVSNKWGILALLALTEGDYRFNALRRRVEGVSEKMLAQALQTLERDGFLVRDVRSTFPPRVQYRLTSLGREVAAQLHGLTELLEASTEVITAARGAYDARPPRSAPTTPEQTHA